VYRLKTLKKNNAKQTTKTPTHKEGEKKKKAKIKKKKPTHTQEQRLQNKPTISPGAIC